MEFQIGNFRYVGTDTYFRRYSAKVKIARTNPPSQLGIEWRAKLNLLSMCVGTYKYESDQSCYFSEFTKQRSNQHLPPPSRTSCSSMFVFFLLAFVVAGHVPVLRYRDGVAGEKLIGTRESPRG